MATLQICYKDSAGNLKCVSGNVGSASAAAPSDTSTVQKGVAAAAGNGPDFDNIQQAVAQLRRNVGKDRPSAASFFYFE